MVRRWKVEPGPGVELPITPMLDMAFQLLAFFVIFYHPSASEGQIQLSLPAGGEARAKAEMEVDPAALSDTDIEPPADLTVVIKTRQDGINDTFPSQYVVEGLQGSSTSMNTLKELGEYLQKEITRLRNERQEETKQLRAAAKAVGLTDDEKKRLKQVLDFPIKIKPAGKLRYAFVVEVMDASAKVGFTSFAFAPPPDMVAPAG
jgi:biopolymer transport protein ExbD